MPNLQFKYNSICKQLDDIKGQAVITRSDLIKIDLLTKIKEKIHNDIAHRLQDRLDVIGD